MRVELREAVEDDLPILFRNQGDPEASAMAAFPSRDWGAFVAHRAKIHANPDMLVRTIVVDGEVRRHRELPEEADRDVGYWIGGPSGARGCDRGLRAFLELEPRGR
jgi:hypothetical protein